ncbi:gamma-glutamyltransferase family protein [uncultured Jannaschia sp.]|uniref:gamma-glutamyltransferase family protein n=1 Tax=uncultured Jannaschia sp. TaxID=293347 RepID=UPI002606194E|nr:gamma-glutamyltransferase [uncultured Jannaschia sp.]
MTFTTRPEIKGSFGAVASTHWIASAVGMKMLEAGGSAADAAAATAFTLNVVEPHLNGPMGDAPIMVQRMDAAVPDVICGQGPAPAGATIEHYRAEGLDFVPGSGLLATVIPGAFDGWMTLLLAHGRLPLSEVLAPAIHYARTGHPALPRVADTIAGLAQFFRDEWPSSYETWVPGGRAPEHWSMIRNPALADTWARLAAEADAAGGREAGIEAARRAFAEGFVAQAVDDWMREACVMDAAGGRRRGVLTGADMAGWRATTESPASIDQDGWTIWKPGFWSQGPVQLQALRLLEGRLPEDTHSAEFVHLVTEALKLAMADREAYYGDPLHTDIPAETLLSRDYAASRAAGIGHEASHAQGPGEIAGFDSWTRAMHLRAGIGGAEAAGVGAGEPTMAHLTERRGDTVHIDVVDSDGLMVSATPSGGWLQSSPVVPGLGMPLNSRAQMFWLDEGLPTSLAPGRRPRTTLSPSMVRDPAGTRIAYGTPGGDQQDQWQLVFILRLMAGTRDLQAAIDAPLFHTGHVQASFYPRGLRPGHLMVEPAFGEAVIADLRARGHDLEVAEPWSVGRLTAAARDPDGLIRAAATPRLMQAYAIGR